MGSTRSSPGATPPTAPFAPIWALAEDGLLRLSDAAALHPSLEPLMDVWRRGELAVVEGVGYARPNRSQFSSTDIWHAGSHQAGTEGWLGGLLRRSSLASDAVANAITLADEGEGPPAGCGKTHESEV